MGEIEDHDRGGQAMLPCWKFLFFEDEQTMDHEPSFDVEAYLERIAYDGPRVPSLEVLVDLHRAHLARIPFENLDVRLKRPVRLDIGSLQAKLVRARRGGYCFEQNLLFAAALETLGFRRSTLEARVRPPGAITVLPRTHMVLAVHLSEGDWLVDVGFGGDGPLVPVPLDGTESRQPLACFRVGREDEVRVLQTVRGDAWQDLYAFRLIPALLVDYEMANHFTSTWPSSPFVTTLTAQMTTADARHVLRDNTYTVTDAEGARTRELTTGEVARLLRARFHLPVSDEEVRQALAPAQ